MNIELSIIIPHFNTPKLLNKLLSTIPDNKNIQVLVIDDNSNKNIEIYDNVMANWNSKVEFLKNDTDIKGAGTCRNIGLSHAKGNWILFADADDFFINGMYEHVSRYFSKTVDIVYFSPTSIDIETGQLSNRHERYEKAINDYLTNPTIENLLLLTSKPDNTPWSKLFKRSFIEEYQIRFDEVLYSNDIMFLAKAGCYSRKILASREQIYCVTKNDGSLTTHIEWDSFWQRTQEYITTCLFIKEYYKELNIDIHFLKLTGAGTMYRAFQQKFGIRKYYLLAKEFRKYGIPMMNISLETPIYILKQIKKYHINMR